MLNNVNVSLNVLLIGAGKMAQDYAKVLKAIGVDFKVIGKSRENAATFEIETGVSVLTGGILHVFPELKEKFTHAIVATNVESLSEITTYLLKRGIKTILVEKPGALYLNELKDVLTEKGKKNANIYIAYNRRFYSSVIKAKELIQEDGGIRSFTFDFTELSHVIEKLEKPKEVLQQWFYGNSTHVVDLAFYLGGEPKQFSSFISRGLKWHPNASVFTGSGVTKNNVLFSYHANWESPGRWGVNIFTDNYQMIFKPLEELHIQKKGEFVISKVELEDQLDKDFKPGLYRQVEALLSNYQEAPLLSLEDHYERWETFYKKIVEK
jgi:predicted dehydrogenase